jgi:hypothetical protein
VRSTEGTTEAVASTAIRALSSRKLLVSVGVEAQQPALVAGYAYMVSPFSNGVRARTVIHEQSLRIDGIGMERWSNHDTGIQSMVPSVPLSVKGTPTSLTITNMTPGPLHDVFIHTDSGWYAVAPSIAAGAVHEASGLEQGASNAFDISPSWQTRTELENLRMLLGSIRLPASNSYIEPGWVTIVAGCDPEGMPEITMRPAPEKTYVRSTCIWERYLPAGDQ